MPNAHTPFPDRDVMHKQYVPRSKQLARCGSAARQAPAGYLSLLTAGLAGGLEVFFVSLAGAWRVLVSAVGFGCCDWVRGWVLLCTALVLMRFGAAAWRWRVLCRCYWRGGVQLSGEERGRRGDAVVLRSMLWVCGLVGMG